MDSIYIVTTAREENDMEAEVLSVSAFLDLVNQTLSFALPLVVVEGEVSSFKINQGKWVFFDLKDATSTVSCFMPVYSLKVDIEDGMLIRVAASPNITKWGKFSLTVRTIELSGEGAVKKSFELMKARFEAEGLFATERKRSLPEYPARVALITSAQAAAYNDFLTIISERWPHLQLDHIQVQVQGADAPDQIAAAITQFNSTAANDAGDLHDVLVLIRGGGSAEDLQAFNHEDVVRAVYGSKVPTLVAIGHEDDVTLAELSADVRGATPTDAARRLVPDQVEVAHRIKAEFNQASSAIDYTVQMKNGIVEDFFDLFNDQLHGYSLNLNHTAQQLLHTASARIQLAVAQTESFSKMLSSLNPTAVLSRGYAIASIDGRVVKQASEAKPDSEIMLQLWKGQLKLIRHNSQTKHLYTQKKKAKSNHDQDSQTQFRL